MTNPPKIRTSSLLAWGLLLAALCFGCGEKQDYSGTGELDKKPSNPAATANPDAGTPTSAPAVAVPHQQRPSTSGGK